jgi:hypothetical protein
MMENDMQNEIIGISGDMICEKIVTACNNSEYFALIGDEATDVLTHEQVSVCVRFVDCTGGKVTLRGEFLGFVRASLNTSMNARHASYPCALILSITIPKFSRVIKNSSARFSPVVSLALTKPRNSPRRVTLPPVQSTNLTHTETCSCVKTSVASSPIRIVIDNMRAQGYDACLAFIEVFKPGLGNGFQQCNTYIVRRMF